MALRKIFKVVIIPQIAYEASIWHMLNGKKGNRKTLVTQLVQVWALRARVITEVFKATFVSSLNIEAYLTLIRLKLDKKADQIVARLYSSFFYSTITRNKLVHPRQLFTPLETLKKCHIRLLGISISKLEKRPAYITAPWWKPSAINISCSKNQAICLYN